MEFPTTPEGPLDATENEAAPAAEPKKPRNKPVKKSKPKTKKKAAKKAPKAKAKSKPKAKKRPAKKTKAKKPAKARTGGPARSERLDMRITKADKARLLAKSRKLGIPVTEVVLAAIAKIK